jgi:hypothetical protein
VLGCGIEGLLIPEPEKVPAPVVEEESASAAVGQNRPVMPKPRGIRSLPPR